MLNSTSLAILTYSYIPLLLICMLIIIAVATITVKGDEDEVKAKMEQLNPVFYELMDLSLEEIFISETEVHGYDIKKLIF